MKPPVSTPSGWGTVGFVEWSGRWGEPLAESELLATESFGTRISGRDESLVWLALGGELDVFTAPRLKEALEEATPTASESLVLDLRGLSFIDSSGLAVILGVHQKLAATEERDLRLIIKGSPAVEALFETIGAADYLTIIDGPNALSASGA